MWSKARVREEEQRDTPLWLQNLKGRCLHMVLDEPWQRSVKVSRRAFKGLVDHKTTFRGKSFFVISPLFGGGVDQLSPLVSLLMIP